MVLAVHGLILHPVTTSTVASLLFLGLALVVVSTPFVHRKFGPPWTLEAGAGLAIATIAVTSVPLAGYRPRSTFLLGLGLLTAGYFLLAFATRLGQAWVTGQASAEDGGLGPAWRFGWTRILGTMALAIGLVGVLSQVPRLLGRLVSERWSQSVDAASVHALALVVVVFLAAGTGITLLRLARAADTGGEGLDEGTQPQGGDGSGGPEPSQVEHS